MNFTEILTGINYWAILVAAFSSFVIGSIWYGPLFGKTWMRLKGFTIEDLKKGVPMPAIMILTYLGSVLAAFAMAMFLGKESTVGFGIFAGITIAIFWIGTTRLNDVLYERQPIGLFLLHAGYNLLIYIAIGAIIGGWH